MQRIRLHKEPCLSKKMEPFPFQLDTENAIKDLDYSAVFLEQGLGKTKVAIDVLLYWLEEKLVDTVIIVAKKSLINNWIRELGTHCYIRPRTLTQKSRGNYYILNSPVRLILTNYEVVSSEKERLKIFLRTRNVAIILDESTKIKNPDSKITKTFFELSSLFTKKVILTGTPVANRPYDIWAQIFFLDFGKSLGTDFNDFKQKLNFADDLTNNPALQKNFESELNKVYRKISHFSIRKTKDSGIIELPQKIYQNIETDWEPLQKDLYDTIRDELKAIVLKNGELKEDESEDILKRLLRLVQVASNPKLVDDGYSQKPGKLDCLNNLVTTICANGEKCIVWTSFIDNVNELAKYLNQFGSCKIHGKIDIETRNNEVNKFMKDKNKRVLVATPSSSKEGLTLTVANHVIFYDRGFSLDDYLQAQDRIHRISQEKTCYIYNIIMRESIDVWVDALIKAKELAAKLTQGDITLDYYQKHVTYSFQEILREILANSKKGEKNESTK